MTTQNIGLFKAIGAKMQYLNARQSVISQNIANADTPNYKPQDLRKVDFGAVLDNVSKNNAGATTNVRMKATSAGHIGAGGGEERTRSAKQKETYEVAPAGNAVVMEEQLLKAGKNATEYTLMSNLLQKQVGMLKIAIGQNGR